MADMAAKGRANRKGLPGERNGRAVITDDQARQIRERCRGRYGEQTALAREFGVSITVVNKIVRGRNWTHATA